jgi:hypothetical protein
LTGYKPDIQKAVDELKGESEYKDRLVAALSKEPVRHFTVAFRNGDLLSVIPDKHDSLKLKDRVVTDIRWFLEAEGLNELPASIRSRSK